MNDATTTTPVPGKRPTLLTVLCILSFVAAGLSIIFGVIGLGAGAMVNAVNEAAIASGDAEAIEGAAEAQEMMHAATEAAGTSLTTLFAISLVLTIIGLVGVIMMWQLKKTGFYVYTGAQVLGIAIPVLMGGEFGMWGALFSILFIVLYGMNLKYMR